MQKIWVDKKTGYKCMILYSRWLDILGVLRHTGFGTVIKKQGKEWKFHKQKISVS